MNDRTLDSYSAIINGLNGPIHYEPPFIIPPPYHAWCHPCNKGFMSIDDLQKHWVEEHINKQLKNQYAKLNNQYL